jgi:glycosyltransferase involved in cell wall biosynthesis
VIRRITIISACGDPWGGSEELWWSAACRLRAQGNRICVLRTFVDPRHPRIRHLQGIGCRVIELVPSASARLGLAASSMLPTSRVPTRWDLNVGRGQMMVAALILALQRPDLVLISQSLAFDGTHFANVCRRLGLGYVLIAHRVSELDWPADDVRGYYANAFAGARSCVFVSEHNRRLMQEQLGIALEHAAVFRNPFIAGHQGPLPWPDGDPDELRLACVARLSPSDKGQDLLLRVLAQPRWRERAVKVRFYGQGRGRDGLRELARRLGSTSVSFEGQCSDIERVWRDHHALVLPSRAEGLPLALVEAMMCGRPAVVTDVGGNREVIEDGITGILASDPSVTAIDSALERFWSMRADWEQMGAAAARHIRCLVPDDPGSILADHLLEIANDGSRARRGIGRHSRRTSLANRRLRRARSEPPAPPARTR